MSTHNKMSKQIDKTKKKNKKLGYKRCVNTYIERLIVYSYIKTNSENNKAKAYATTIIAKK